MKPPPGPPPLSLSKTSIVCIASIHTTTSIPPSLSLSLSLGSLFFPKSQCYIDWELGRNRFEPWPLPPSLALKLLPYSSLLHIRSQSNTNTVWFPANRALRHCSQDHPSNFRFTSTISTLSPPPCLICIQLVFLFYLFLSFFRWGQHHEPILIIQTIDLEHSVEEHSGKKNSLIEHR